MFSRFGGRYRCKQVAFLLNRKVAQNCRACSVWKDFWHSGLVANLFIKNDLTTGFPDIDCIANIGDVNPFIRLCIGLYKKSRREIFPV